MPQQVPEPRMTVLQIAYIVSLPLILGLFVLNSTHFLQTIVAEGFHMARVERTQLI